MSCEDEVGFFFELFPDNRNESDDDDETEEEEEEELKRFNPFMLLGSVSAHYGYDYEFVYRKISFQKLTLLNASIPKFKKTKTKEEKEKEKPKDLNSILGSAMNRK